jgi:putative flavoprotein involved in K+ transport
MIQSIDTIIIGGGQGGLATSYHLKQQGREHLILERADCAGSAWRDGRWDSFTMVTPNWTLRLPGAEYQGDDPGGFLSRQDTIEMFAGYAHRFGLPLQTNTEVQCVEPGPAGSFLVRTPEVTYQARHVVVATGLFQSPRIPACAQRLPNGVAQWHSAQYRNPGQLPGGQEGAVLVVGSSQSGCQIAQEIHASGRPVFLCVSGAVRVPRSYRGKDIVEWSNLLGVYDRTADMLPSPQAKFAGNPQMAGKSDGGGINLHQFARSGIRLLGRLLDVQDGTARLAPDLHANLAKADQFEAGMLKGIDAYIEKAGLNAPPGPLPRLEDGYLQPQPTELDLAASGIRSVVWATGYGFDFGLVRFPVFDGDGYPVQQRGATPQPGLDFVGLPWLHKQKSGLLLGVGEDAAYVAGRILAA